MEPDTNYSAGSHASKVLRLVELDWAQTPYSHLVKAFPGANHGTFFSWRNTDLYRSTLEAMTAEHRARLEKLPGTVRLREDIKYGMSLALNRIIDILASDRSANRDVISAATLMAKLDGRFLRTDDSTSDAASNASTESIAAELVKALERARPTESSSVQ